MCRTPWTACTAAYGGTRTSTDRPGARVAQHREEVLDQQPRLLVGARVCGQRLRPPPPGKRDGVGRALLSLGLDVGRRLEHPEHLVGAGRRAGLARCRHFSTRSLSSPDSFLSVGLGQPQPLLADRHQAVLLLLGVLGAVDSACASAIHCLRNTATAALPPGCSASSSSRTLARFVDRLPDPVALVTGGLGRFDDQAVLRELAQVEARLVGGDSRRSARSAARIGPPAPSSSRIRLRTGWAMARSMRGSEIWGSSVDGFRGTRLTYQIAHALLRTFSCALYGAHMTGYRDLSRNRDFTILWTGQTDQRPGQPGEHVRLPADHLRPHRLGDVGRGRRGGVPARHVRRAASGRRAGRPGRPPAADAHGEWCRRRPLHLARRRRCPRRADRPAPRGGGTADRRRERARRAVRDVGDPLGRPSRGAVDGAQPEPGPPAHRLARRWPAGRHPVRRRALAAVRLRCGLLRRLMGAARPPADRPVRAAARRAAAQAAPRRGRGHPLHPGLAVLPGTWRSGARWRTCW